MLLEYTVPPDEVPQERAAINRENAQKSTGPKTEAGKQKSSLNALRHGLTGQTVVLPSEDLAAYERFTQNFHDDFKPSGALEIQLVQSLASQAWRLNRAEALETNLLTLGLHRHAESFVTENAQVHDALAIAAALGEQTKALSTLSLHQNRIARTFERTLKQLREIQAERRAKDNQEMLRASWHYHLHAEENKASGKIEPYNPADHGFVFTTAEIEQYIYREHRDKQAYQTACAYKSAA
jgi:hypothetical protein